MMNLAGKRIAVVGAARGIGRAIAEQFAAEGCLVSAFDRQAVANETDRWALESTLGDVTSFEQVTAFANSMAPADHVVFAVGGGSGKFGFPFWNLNPADWSRTLEVNLIGAVNVAHAFAKQLIDRRQGSMLFIVSVAGQTGSQTDPPYSASKAALINFMQCAAKDFAAYGVRANALSPGMVKTDLNHSVWEASQRTLPPSAQQDYETWGTDKVRRVSPLGQWQTVGEIAAMAVYLASDKARNITGQTINIDGGQVMHS